MTKGGEHKMFKQVTAIVLLCCSLITYPIAHACEKEDLLPVQSQGKWGYVNNMMEETIPAQWDYASYFRMCEVAMVGIKQSDGSLLFGLIDTQGDYLVPCEYVIFEGESEDFFGGENGYYLIQNLQGTLCGYYDIQNHYFCEPIYEDVDVWYRNDENIISVSKKGEAGRLYIHAITGEQIGTAQYIETYPWHQNAALCRSFDGNMWIQFLNGSRKKIDEEYDVRSDIRHGLFIVANKNGQYSLMNLQANIVTAWYNSIELTPEGRFYGENDNYSGTIYCQIETDYNVFPNSYSEKKYE